MSLTVVDADDFLCARVKADGGPAGAKEAFQQLEARLESLKGRKMYGIFYPDQGDYFASVALDPAHRDGMGFETTTVPGGRYARRIFRNWAGNESSIKGFFDGLVRDALADGLTLDESRPSIEFYRSSTELIAMVPVK